MSLPDYLLEPDDENTIECTGDPYTCQCDACRTLWTDMEADREYDKGEEAA
jgi:hypothetical protein